jgi:hypothetical protein
MQTQTVDHRTPTHDGFIWPQPRDRMDDAGAVRQRMAEDISQLVADQGEDAVVDADDLIRLGWRPEQVRSYSAAALSSLPRSRPRRPTGNRSTVRRQSLASEAACLAIFAVPVVLLARRMLGV